MRNHTRRELLLGAAALAGAASTAQGAAADAGWQIGCWTRPWNRTEYPAVFDAIAEAGYSYVGLMALTRDGKPANLTCESTPEQAAAVAREARRRGLKTISLWGGSFPFAQSHEAGMAALKRLIDNCTACGSPHLLLGGVEKPEQAALYYKVVAECCGYAAEKRVKMGVKPHGGTNANGAACRKVVETVGSRSFGIWYDPGNIFYYSDGKLDPVDDALTVDGLVVGMCVKDFRPPKEVMLTPGTGRVNFREVMARLKKGGFRSGPLVVECLDSGDVAQARQARRLVEDLTRI